MPANLIFRHPRITRALQTSLEEIGSHLLRLHDTPGASANFLFTDDQELAGLNQTYRQRPEPTNVLSFPFEAAELARQVPLEFHELGDIAISVETADREAQSAGITLLQRLTWLMVHGFLHLTGLDHERTEAEAADMADREEELITAIDISRRPHMPQLAINVDHVATIRQARGTTEPDPVTAAAICELAGAKGIVVHLREDRRHIQDRDLRLLRETVQTKLNLEMGAAREIITIALELKPDMVTLVPEKRRELTTEGGLDVVSQRKKLAKTIEKLGGAGIPVSLFVDPDPAQIKASLEVGATFVEIHTGRYADAIDEAARQREFELIEIAAEEAFSAGLRVNAGHGLNYTNTGAIAALDVIEELSIGHAVISRAIFSGLDRAVREMAKLIDRAAAW